MSNVFADICIICNKPMSSYSKFMAQKNGQSCTICNPCEQQVRADHGDEVFTKLVGTNGLIDQIKGRLSNLTEPEEIREAIYDLVVDFVNDIKADNSIIDSIFDTLS